MEILLDSHILIWHAFDELPVKAPYAFQLLENEKNELYFSSTSLWEIAIKSDLNKRGFNVKPDELEQGLVEGGFLQLEIKNAHIYALKNLPKIHGDPFDRLLLAQAIMENMHFLTVDEKILEYPFDLILDAKK